MVVLMHMSHLMFSILLSFVFELCEYFYEKIAFHYVAWNICRTWDARKPTFGGEVYTILLFYILLVLYIC
jgi:hypothetical protein